MTVPPPCRLMRSMAVWIARVDSPLRFIFTVAIRSANTGRLMPLTSNGAVMGSISAGMYSGPAFICCAPAYSGSSSSIVNNRFRIAFK